MALIQRLSASKTFQHFFFFLSPFIPFIFWLRLRFFQHPFFFIQCDRQSFYLMFSCLDSFLSFSPTRSLFLSLYLPLSLSLPLYCIILFIFLSRCDVKHLRRVHFSWWSSFLFSALSPLFLSLSNLCCFCLLWELLIRILSMFAFYFSLCASFYLNPTSLSLSLFSLCVSLSLSLYEEFSLNLCRAFISPTIFHTSFDPFWCPHRSSCSRLSWRQRFKLIGER